jgi:hypothetical protein
MATFAISRSPNGYSASVDDQDIGREVDAAKFNTPPSFGQEATGLSKTFGSAVNDEARHKAMTNFPVSEIGHTPKM